MEQSQAIPILQQEVPLDELPKMPPREPSEAVKMLIGALQQQQNIERQKQIAKPPVQQGSVGGTLIVAAICITAAFFTGYFLGKTRVKKADDVITEE